LLYLSTILASPVISHVDIYPTMSNIEVLKEKMRADEFLAYCRQELIDPIEVIK